MIDLPNDEEEDKKAKLRVLDELAKELDGFDKERVRRTMLESADEDSEQPIDPRNIDPKHTEAENEGGHPGELSAGMVDDSEADSAEDEEDKKLLARIKAKK